MDFAGKLLRHRSTARARARPGMRPLRSDRRFGRSRSAGGRRNRPPGCAGQACPSGPKAAERSSRRHAHREPTRWMLATMGSAERQSPCRAVLPAPPAFRPASDGTSPWDRSHLIYDSSGGLDGDTSVPRVASNGSRSRRRWRASSTSLACGAY